MKRKKYSVYFYLCQASIHIVYGKCTCKVGAGGYGKHFKALLFQLVEY